jgi:NitT/TauT family transport system substrate-binding protein
MPKLSPPAVLLFTAALLLPLLAHGAQALRLGTNVWPGYEPLYLAAEREHWRDRIGVRLVEYPSATEVIRAFRNRALEAAALTLDEVLTLREAEIPLKVIAVLDVSAGGDVIVGKPDIGRFADLRGRRVGVESTALGAFFLTRALELNGMTLDDIEAVHLDVSAHLGAYREGRIDAAVTFEPVRTQLLNDGARELFSSREIPGEIVDVLVVHADILESHEKPLRDLLGGWFRALEYLDEAPMEAARFTARRLQITPEEVIASYQGLELPDARDNVTLIEQTMPQTLARLQEMLIREGLLQQPQDTQGLLEAGLLPR